MLITEPRSVFPYRGLSERLRLDTAIRMSIQQVREPHHRARPLRVRTGERLMRNRNRFPERSLGTGVIATPPQDGAEAFERADHGGIGAATVPPPGGDRFELVGLGACQVAQVHGNAGELPQARGNVRMRVAENGTPNAQRLARERVRRYVLPLASEDVRQ
jgi:hypothetical protein